MKRQSFAIEAVQKFRCIGAECEDTCCTSWRINVDNETAQKYKTQPDLREILETDEKGEAELIHNENGNCPKYTNGLCGIQNKYGASYLCDTCFFYPRKIHQLGEYEIVGGTLSCPEMARLLLLQDGATQLREFDRPRPEKTISQNLPSNLSPDHAISIHMHLLQMVQSRAYPPHVMMARLVSIVFHMYEYDIVSWHDAVQYFIQNVDRHMPAPEADHEDPFKLTLALLSLSVRGSSQYSARLYPTIRMMERALRIDMHWKNCTMDVSPQSPAQWQQMKTIWREHCEPALRPVLWRWIEAQLTASVFPFALLGETIKEQAQILAVRFATIRLALMSACFLEGQIISEAEQVKIIQSISRLMDHVTDSVYSVTAYNEAGWWRQERLLGIVGEI